LIGLLFQNPSAGGDTVVAVARDSSGVYILGTDTTEVDARWRLEKRNLTTGAVIWTVVSDPSTTEDDIPFAVATDGTSVFVAGADRVLGATNDQWRVEKRSAFTGALDTGFDTDGILQINWGAGADQIRAMALTTTAIVIAGSDTGAGGGQWRIQKRGLTGTPPSTDWEVTVNPSANADEVTAMATDGTSVYLAGTDRTNGATNALWRIEKRDLLLGGADATFTTVSVDPGSGDDIPRVLRVDGSSIFVGGLDAATNSGQWRIEKRSAITGAPTLAFDTDGILSLDFSTVASDELFDLVISGTTLYLIGADKSVAATNDRWRIEARDTTAGAVVAGFGTSGVITDNPSTTIDQAKAAVVDSSGLITAGTDEIHGTGKPQWRIDKRSLTTGARDSSFGSPGAQTSDPGEFADEIRALAVDASAVYLLGTDSATAADIRWRVEKRSLSTGDLDTGFGVNGIVALNPSTGADQPYGLAINSTDMFIVGMDLGTGAGQWRIDKLSLSTGASQAGFPISVDFVGASPDELRAVAVDSTGVYVAGTDATGNGIWRMRKYPLAGGAFLWEATSDPSGSADVPRAMAVDSTGVFIAGTDAGTNGGQWRLEKRSLTTGTADGTFGGGAALSVNFSAGADVPNGMFLDSTGLYIVGKDADNGGEWRIERRNSTTGEMLFSQASVPGSASNEAFAVVGDGTAVYIAGAEAASGTRWRVEKRTVDELAPFDTFGSSGAVTNDPSSGTDSAFTIAQDSTGIYVGGNDSVPGNLRWRFEKRTK